MCSSYILARGDSTFLTDWSFAAWDDHRTEGQRPDRVLCVSLSRPGAGGPSRREPQEPPGQTRRRASGFPRPAAAPAPSNNGPPTARKLRLVPAGFARMETCVRYLL
jgi:hypothetical protein